MVLAATVADLLAGLLLVLVGACCWLLVVEKYCCVGQLTSTVNTTAPLQHSAVADDKPDCNNHVILEMVILIVIVQLE